jgi:8-oxo-dGTP pyrophosphatase MutT (NUDIX family)
MPIPNFVVELRKHIGQASLWLPGVTAVIRRDDSVLLVRRSDNLRWAAVTGIVDPGEEPAAAARREALEETGVQISVDRLSSISAGPSVTHANGDLAAYLDHTFACTWLAGDAHVADDESVDVGWFALDALPDVGNRHLERIAAATSDEVATRFRT